ncbi:MULTISPECIES: sensor histidine kinase [unclassified Curtobacterium]|uniref:sensor histidine kinase n=1 Tax=unclassified Curtobacterium TaxID=257496 RepID=UPI000F4A5CFE|nr:MULTISPECIES: ATP-binding protein [unclassified Curtobacterium]ROQ06969.1 histidine kinase [Curtobacterium sp. PhB171]ROQ27895.1 histidine kinase [Curtobacterium sp. PhB170]ROS34825.1 histidine kinase [Curtobacterium sp. PhB131]ROS72808.1 histidine kinase [Curtobacterium sp. PhB141]
MSRADHLRPVLERIAAQFPELADDPVLMQNLVDNVTSMIAEAHARYAAGAEDSVVSNAYLDPDHLATGALHAEQAQHPAGAMLAAEMLFDAYLPLFVDEVGAESTAEVLRATRALHAGIWSRFPAGAVAYTEALRQRVTTAHLDSRTQIARDLHDRVAHGILAGLQRLDLVLLTDPPAGDRADQLDYAARLLRGALGDVQDLAVSLHARVGDALLDDALARHARDLFSDDDRLSFNTTGTPEHLPNWQAEEALTILLEALTNRRKHAPGSAAAVHFAWTPAALVVTVSDDGPGFDPAADTDGRLGQQTMRERAAVIGARLDVESAASVDSAPDTGTTVRLTIPRGTL